MKSTVSKQKSGEAALARYAVYIDETGLRGGAGYRPLEACYRAEEALQQMSEALKRTGEVG
jgi:hypothetical protein